MLRALVFAWGVVAASAGAVILLRLPIASYLKPGLALLWLLECARELWALRRGGRRLCELRLAAGGEVSGISPRGDVLPLELLPGSMLLRRLGWLRLRFADGLTHGELFTGDARQDPEWHRLQLIWRQRAAAFGRQQRS
ncbi:MAG: hypothetical protein R3192_07060 [Woeseiaceae bacterium]|nr:hypothetical protein [Woeseiaceae bacterium]